MTIDEMIRQLIREDMAPHAPLEITDEHIVAQILECEVEQVEAPVEEYIFRRQAG